MLCLNIKVVFRYEENIVFAACLLSEMHHQHLPITMGRMLKAVNHECKDLSLSFEINTFWTDFNISDCIGFVNEFCNER